MARQIGGRDLARGWSWMSRPVEISKPSRDFRCVDHNEQGVSPGSRALAEETAVAFVYGGSTEAVMMATPADLEDFAIGFSITEGLIERPDQITDLSVIHGPNGIELRMWLASNRDAAYRGRRRRMAGPTGCGLCGIESLAQAVRPAVRLRHGGAFDGRWISEAVAALASAQTLNQVTRATHAAGFWRPAHGMLAIREDVGRHNALDKLAGVLKRQATDVSGGAVVITSRVSVEMVQKTAAIGAPVLIAISAPTALAVRLAEAANITLIALARGQSSQVFTHPGRLTNRRDKSTPGLGW
jgi:FdhD protein